MPEGFQPVPIVATGDLWTATNHNIYIRENEQILADAVDSKLPKDGSEPMTGNLILANGAIALGRDAVTVFSVVADGTDWNALTTAGARYLAKAVSGVHAPVENEAYWYVIVIPKGDYNGGAELLQIALPYNYAESWYWRYKDADGNYSLWMSVGKSWRLTRTLTPASAGIDWMTSAQRLDIFSLYDEGGDIQQSVELSNLFDDDSTTIGFSVKADGTAWFVLDAGRPLPVGKIKVYIDAGPSATYTIYASNDHETWTDVGSFDTDSQGETEFDITDIVARYWKIYIDRPGTSAEQDICYLNFYLISSLVIANIPVGTTCSLHASDGTELEAARYVGWAAAPYVLFTTPIDDIAEIRVTKPDGTTPWLAFAVDEIEGGALVNGDVLTLYLT